METLAMVGIGFLLILGFTVFTGAPYVPSRRRDIMAAFTHLYALSSKDTLLDLGCGDGVVLRAARSFGAKAIGYELGPVYALIAKLLARGDKGQVVLMRNYWQVDFPAETTVVYAFSDTRDIKKLYKKVEQQATKLHKNIALITYGIAVPHQLPHKTHQAYFLYTVAPCRTPKA